MSTINTNGINVNYPVPGVNNPTQGFRDNFANIKTNLDTASTEITDLQNNVVLKQALANSTLNNDMAGTLISNATTRGFRQSSYNLGNALSGTVFVDTSLGDVQYGTIAGNVTFQFGGWSPINTLSSVVLKLGVSNANAVITFPNEVISTYDGFGVTVLENYQKVNDVATVTIPPGISQLNYELQTLDCGNTISITPLTRPYQTTEIQKGVPPVTGLRGDVKGRVSVGPSVTMVTASETSNTTVAFNASAVVLLGSTIDGTKLTVGTTDDAVLSGCYISGTTLFVGQVDSGNIQIGMQLTGTGVLENTTIIENLTGTGNTGDTGSTWRVSLSQALLPPVAITGSTPIQEGMLLTGTGVLANTYIVSNDNGTGNGSVWNISPEQSIPTPTTITGTTGIVGNILYVGQVVSGSINNGTILSGLGVIANTTVTNYISGFGSGSIWAVSNEQYVSPTSMSGVRDAITCDTTLNFYLDMPVVFTGNTFGNIVAGTTYYVKDIMTTTDFSVTLTPGGDGETFVLSNAVGTMNANPVSYLYVCAEDFNGTTIGPKGVLNTYATTNTIKITNTVDLVENAPIIFEGVTFGGIRANTSYYIKSIDAGNANITISQTLYNGVAGAEYEIVTANASAANACQAYSIIGSSIWRQIPLLPGNDANTSISATSLSLSENLSVGGNALITGDLTVNGSVNYGNTVFTNITVPGNLISTGNLFANGIAEFSNVSNLKILGGINGYFLQTDGEGNLTWALASGGGSGTSPAGSTNQVQFNLSGALSASPEFTFNPASNIVTAAGGFASPTGEITSQDLTLTGNATMSSVGNVFIPGGNNGQYLQTDGTGNLSWADGTAGTTTAAGGANTQVQYNDAGAIAGKAGFTFDNVTDVLSIPGDLVAAGDVSAVSITGALTTAAQPNVTSLGTLTSLNVNGNTKAVSLYANSAGSIDPSLVQGFAAGNIVETTFSPTGLPGLIVGNSTGQHGAIVYSSGEMIFATETPGVDNTMGVKARLYANGTFDANNFVGTLLTNTQTNITRVGTLSSLSVIGNVNANTFVGRLANGNSNINIPLASGNVNISAVGNANVFVVHGTGANIAGSLSTAGNINAYGSNAGVRGKFITANGNVTGNLDISSNVTGNMGIRAISSVFTDNVAASTIDYASPHAIDKPTLSTTSLSTVTLSNAATFAITGEPLEGTNINILNAYALYVRGNNLIEGNIEQVGNLSTGNISVANDISVSGTLSVTDETCLIVPGGAEGYFLQTDGAGGLTWAAGTSTPTGTGSAAGSNRSVQYTDGLGVFQANAGFTFNEVSGNLSVPGNLSVTQGITGTLLTPNQSGITVVGTLQNCNTLGNFTGTGSSSGLIARYVSLTNGFTGNANISNIANSGPMGFRTMPTTFTDNVAGSGNTIANVAPHVIGQPNLAAANTSVTFTNASTLKITGAPIANTNVTITNAYGLWVDGNVRLSNAVYIGGNITACGIMTLNDVDSLKIPGGTGGYYLQTDGAGNLQWSQGTIDAISSPGGADTQVQYNDGGTLTGNANFTFDKISGNLLAPGNIKANTGYIISGAVTYANTDGTAGQVLTTYGNGLTYWSGGGSGVSNGSSSITIPVSSGNIQIAPASGSNVNITGNLQVSNKIKLGAVTLTNTAAATNGYVLKGNTDGSTYWGSATGTSIDNGTSNVLINSSGGNITMAVSGSNRVTISSSGINTSGLVVGGITYVSTVPSIAGQVLTAYANGVTYWSGTGAGTATSIANGTAKVETLLNANVNLSAAGNANVFVVTGTGVNVAGTLNSTGAATIGSTLTAPNVNISNNLSAQSFIIASGGITTVSGTSKTLSAADNGRVIYFTSTSAITVTTASGLGAGYSVILIQGGTGQITLAQGPSTTRVSYANAYKSAGQYATISIICPVADTFFMSGQTVA